MFHLILEIRILHGSNKYITIPKNILDFVSDFLAIENGGGHRIFDFFFPLKIPG